jgi:hypothetical protein
MLSRPNAYLEHRSAIAYVAMGHDPAYVARYRAIYPLGRACETTQHGVWTESAEGHCARALATETWKCASSSSCLSELTKPDIELVLFDISQPLLNTAYQHALDTFGEQSHGPYPDASGELSWTWPLSPGQLRARERSAAADLHDVGKHARQPRQRATLLQALYVALPAGGLLGA